MTTTEARALPPPPHQLLAQASLFLDLDGTLIEIAARPDAVQVDAGLIQLLDGLSRRLDGRVVVVSGRPAADLHRLLGPARVAIAGSHGAERQLPAGHLQTPAPAGLPDHVLTQLTGLASRHPGVLIEVKPFGVALHYRLAPDSAGACLAAAGKIAAAEGFLLQPGKQVIELKFHPISKGDAVRAFMSSPPLSAGRPLFIGDDLTDEAGFAATAALGGAGILVGPPRPTEASYRLADVASALQWLGQAMADAP